MAAIPFTQYQLPYGHPVQVSIDRPDEVAEKAQRIIWAGYAFEVEKLSSGNVSLTIFNPMKDEDVAMRLVPDGPEVPLAVDDLIIEFGEVA